jgi:hypothetical protein
MQRSMILRRTLVILSALCIGALIAAPSPVLAQDPNDPNNNQNQQLLGSVAGVVVDADGVVRMQSFVDPTGQLHRQRQAAARAALDRNLAKRSTLRKISLNRLEAAIKENLEAGKPVNDEMRYLAGLTRVQFIFYYPETNDIVLAGPAEGFAPDLSGRVPGIERSRAAAR